MLPYVLFLAEVFPGIYDKFSISLLCPAIMTEYQTSVTAGTVGELTQHH
jgi:hypothetical protein